MCCRQEVNEMNILWTEWMKTKRTAFRRMLFLLPACVSGCVVFYAAYRGNLPESDVISTFFIAWAALLLPVEAGIAADFLAFEEEEAGNFTGFLQVNVPRSRLYLGKYAMAALSVFMSTMLAAGLLWAGMHLLAHGKTGLLLYLEHGFRISLCACPLLAIHLWLSVSRGMGASVGLSLGGMLLAALLGTTPLGNDIWYMVPWTYPVKMAAAQTFPLVFLWWVLSLAGGTLWFAWWDGEKSRAVL